MRKLFLLLIMFVLNGCATYLMWKIDEKEEKNHRPLFSDPVIAGYYHIEKNEFLLLGVRDAYLFKSDHDFKRFQPIYNHALPYQTSFSQLNLDYDNSFTSRVRVIVGPSCFCQPFTLEKQVETALLEKGFRKNTLGYYEIGFPVSGKRFSYDKDELDAAHLDVGLADVAIRYPESSWDELETTTLTKIALTPFMLKKDLSWMASTNPYLLAVFSGVAGLTVWVVDDLKGGIVPP